MKVFIDADACPVVNETVTLCREFKKECIIICDTSHAIERDGATTIVVEKGADSADFRLVNMLSNGDLAITQDYALAAMSLSKGARIINQNGMEYTDKNIDFSYNSRYYDYIAITVPGIAVYQIENVSMALCALETLLNKEEMPTVETIQSVLKTTVWEGRMEEG